MKAFEDVLQEQDDRLEEDALPLSRAVVPEVRHFGAVNWRGLMTLTLKEIVRFGKVWIQTILSPLVMTLLFYAVFSVVMEMDGRMIGPVSYLQFLIPGLVMMSIAQNAFINTSSSLILSKIQGNIVDVLMPPLSPMELTIGYTLGGVARGLIVGVVTMGALSLISPFTVYDVGYVLYHAVMGSAMLALMGVITGIWGDKFDHLSAIQNFIIMPATFLSGTFFTVASLPKQWALLCVLNPFFYMIDGFRYGLTGHADGALLTGLAVLFIVNLCLFNIAYWMFARGTRLKP